MQVVCRYWSRSITDRGHNHMFFYFKFGDVQSSKVQHRNMAAALLWWFWLTCVQDLSSLYTLCNLHTHRSIVDIWFISYKKKPCDYSKHADDCFLTQFLGCLFPEYETNPQTFAAESHGNSGKCEIFTQLRFSLWRKKTFGYRLNRKKNQTRLHYIKNKM